MLRLSTYIFLIIATCAFFQSCSVTNKLPAGDALYTGASIKLISDSLTKTETKDLQESLELLMRPIPNQRLFGIPIKLWFYQHSGNVEKEKGIGHFIRTKLGEAPVLASSVDISKNEAIIVNNLSNNGFFQAAVKSDSTHKNKKASIEYIATSGIGYTLRKITFNIDSSEASRTIDSMRKKSLLKPGERYSLEKIKLARERIDARLKEKGYYYFSPDYLLAKVDSTVGNNQVDLFLIIKTETPKKALAKYYINDIVIYPNYNITQDSLSTDSTKVTLYKDFKIIDPERNFKPLIFDRTMFFHNGDVYNRTDHNMALNRLVNIGTFKFVKNRFTDVSTTDSSLLNTYYYLTTRKKKSIKLELLGNTNSANYAGSELNLSWRNRNLLRGAELLTLKVFGGIDVQLSGQSQGYNIYKAGSELSLTFPRFWPTNFKASSQFVPKSIITLGYDYQNRQKLYTINNFRLSFGYIWKESISKEHNFYLLDITYANSSKVSQEYYDQIAVDPTLADVIEKQLIIGPRYSFTYNTNNQIRKRHNFYYKGQLDMSAALLGTIQGANIADGNVKSLFSVPYSQYVKMEHDIRWYWRVDRKNVWANRINIGLGMPFGNSLALPFVKQFYTGGSNGLRAFRARTVGPGTYLPAATVNGFIPDQTGDIKIELNSEFRFPISGFVKGAAFVDGGNIWLYNDNANKPGAAFSSSFLKELAVGAGVGLRVDLSILLVRVDLAMPMRKPWLADGERWVLDDINFGAKSWRRDNLVLNIAIGMPF